MQPSRNNPSSKPRVTLEEIRSLVQRSIDVAETLDKGTSEVKPPLRAVESLPSREGQRTAPALRAEIPPDNKLSKQISELIRQTSPVGPQRPRIEDQTRGGIAGSQQNRPDFPYAPKGSDVIPAMLTKDEFVVRAGPAQENRALLEAINNSIGNISNPTPYHSSGGPVYLAAGSGTSRDLAIAKDALKGDVVGAILKVVQGIVDTFDEFPEALKKSAEQVFTPTTFGEQINAPVNFVKTTAEWAGNIPGMGLITDLVKIGAEYVSLLGESIDGLRNWNRELYENNIRFKEFSGGMAAVAAQQMVRDIWLSRERGDRLAPTAMYQAEKKHALEVTVSKMEDAVTSAQNVISGIFSRKLNNFLKQITVHGVGLETWAETLQAWADAKASGKGINEVEKELFNISPEGPVRTDKWGKPKRFKP